MSLTIAAFLRPLPPELAAAVLAESVCPSQKDMTGAWRGRALLASGSYETALECLAPLRERLHGLSCARVEIDLLYLSYYLARPEGRSELFESAIRLAAPDGLLLAEAYLALSLCAIADNDVTRAINALSFARDALRGLPEDASFRFVAAAIHRQLAHVLAQAAEYTGAASAADEAMRLSNTAEDGDMVDRSVYARGYVEWLRGDAESALGHLEDAELRTRTQGTALWRWVLLCLARVHAELGHPVEARQLAARSGFDQPEEHGFILLSTGDVEGCLRALEAGRAPTIDELPFRSAVRGLALMAKGDDREAAPLLTESMEQLTRAGLMHYASGIGLHLAFCHERARLPHSRVTLLTQTRFLAARGAAAFAWFDPVLAAWICDRARNDPASSAFVRKLQRRLQLPGMSDRAESTEKQVTAWRRGGLTWREIEILQRLLHHTLTARPLTRKQVAHDLGITAGTLKVHISRIRHKLGVTGARGDRALLAALSDPATERPV